MADFVPVKQSEVVAFLRLLGVDTSQSFMTDIHLGVAEGKVTVKHWSTDESGQRLLVGNGDERRIASETSSWGLSIIHDV